MMESKFELGSFWKSGPTPGDLYKFPDLKIDLVHNNSGVTRSQAPITTGTSVVGIVFDGGVCIAADTLGSYGSLARFRTCQRVMKVNDNTILGAGGDYADFQYLRSVIEQKVIDEECYNDGFGLKPKSLHCWLTRVLYNRRSKFDPFWNFFVVGGLQDGEPFLGYVDKLGTAYEAKEIATGFGAYIAIPLLREYRESNPVITKDAAKKLLTDCMRVLYYRDARSFNKYEMVTVSKDECILEGPNELDTNWDIAHLVKGYE